MTKKEREWVFKPQPRIRKGSRGEEEEAIFLHLVMTTRADSSMILLSETGREGEKRENRNGNGGIQTRRDKNGIMESVITQREI